MSIKLETFYAPNPQPERAVSFLMSANDAADRFVYPYSTCVYLRGLTDTFDVDTYYVHSAKVTAASYSPGGRWIASGDECGNLRVWTPQNAEKTTQLEIRPISGPILDLTWTEDSAKLSVIGHGANGAYGSVMSSDTGAPMGEVIGHTKPVNTGCLRPVRPFKFVTAGDDNTHVFYKGPPFKFDHSTCDHQKFVLCARYAPNGSVYATVGLDGKVFVYDGVSGEKLRVFSFGSGISSISFSPDSTQALVSLLCGKSLVIKVEDGSVVEEYDFGQDVHNQQCGTLWTKKHKISISLNGTLNYLENGKSRSVMGHTCGLSSIAMIPGGFVSADSLGTVLFRKFKEAPYAVWNPFRGAPGVKAICTINNNAQVLVGCADFSLNVLSVEDGSLIRTIKFDKPINALLPFGDDVIIQTSDSLVLFKNDEFIPIPTSEKVSSAAVSQATNEIVYGTKSGMIFFIDIDGSVRGSAKSHDYEVTTISYSHDGSKVATSSNKFDITVWSRENLNEPIHTGWRFHSLRINKILFSKDGNHLITVSGDRTIRQWSLEKKRKYVEEKIAHFEGVVSAEWVDDSRIITIGDDSSIRQWIVEMI